MMGFLQFITVEMSTSIAHLVSGHVAQTRALPFGAFQLESTILAVTVSAVLISIFTTFCITFYHIFTISAT